MGFEAHIGHVTESGGITLKKLETALIRTLLRLRHTTLTNQLQTRPEEISPDAVVVITRTGSVPEPQRQNTTFEDDGRYVGRIAWDGTQAVVTIERGELFEVPDLFEVYTEDAWR
jgi:hypothetical protein